MGYLNPYGSAGYYTPYGTLNLTNSSPAQVFTEPLSLIEVRKFLNIDDPTPEPADDAELTAFISAARSQAELLQCRDLIVKQWDLSLDYWVSWQIALRAPLRSVDLVQYTDVSGVTTPVAPSGYFVDKNKRPGVVMSAYNAPWPSFSPAPSSAVLIRFTSGFALSDMFWDGRGALVKNGMKLLISHWFNKRLPFEKGANAASEYPYAVTAGLSAGAMMLVH